MALKMSIPMLFMGTLATLLSAALAIPSIATYYPDPQPSECYGAGVKVVGNTAAVSTSLWANRSICGKSFRVTCTGPTKKTPNPCTGKSVVVMVIDYCPSCGGTFVLAKQAFVAIANPDAGIIKIDYAPV